MKTNRKLVRAFENLRDIEDIRACLNVIDEHAHHEKSENMRRKMRGSCCTIKHEGGKSIDFVGFSNAPIDMESRSHTVAIGKMICRELTRWGIEHEWNGDAASRIELV